MTTKEAEEIKAFVRELQSDLAEARTQLAQVTAERDEKHAIAVGLQNGLSAVTSQRDDLKARLEAARKDSERLDWLARYWDSQRDGTI